MKSCRIAGNLRRLLFPIQLSASTEANPAYKSVNNCCLTKDGKTLVFGCAISIIPDGVKEIEDFAFFSCARLSSITIPDEVEYIGNWSFGNCKKLVSVNIPQSVKELVLCAFTGTSVKDLFIASVDPDKRTDLIEALRGHRMKNITLHVPQESIYMYRSHPVFKKFQNIV